MDTIQCPHCKKNVIPKIATGPTGARAQICPLCNTEMAGVLQRDITQMQVRVSGKVAAIIGAIALILIVIAYRKLTH